MRLARFMVVGCLVSIIGCRGMGQNEEDIIRAIQNENMDELMRLIEFGIMDCAKLGIVEYSPLVWAILWDKTETSLLLIREKCGIEKSDNIDGFSPLSMCAIKGNKIVAQKLLELGVEVDHCDAFQKTPLIWSASKGRIEVLELLLNSGAQIDCQDGHGRTALHWAVITEQKEVVKILIEKGANIKILDMHNYSPYKAAMENGDSELLEIFGPNG